MQINLLSKTNLIAMWHYRLSRIETIIDGVIKMLSI